MATEMRSEQEQATIDMLRAEDVADAIDTEAILERRRSRHGRGDPLGSACPGRLCSSHDSDRTLSLW